MKRKTTHKKATFTDRLAIAFLSGIISFITALIVWMVLAGLNIGATSMFSFHFNWVIGFTLLMALLGLLMLENVLVNLFSYIWQGICYALGINPKEKL
jgi:putative Mn2+ efflux pump MntP